MKGREFELIILVFRPIVHRSFLAKTLTPLTHMAETTILRDHVIEQRRKSAPKIVSLIQRVKRTRSLLSELEGLCRAANADRWMGSIRKLDGESSDLEAALQAIENRFETGMVTVAIGGLEKAGKTTFIKTLTGIRQLPAFDERCTAVPCEIIHCKGRNDAELDFYSESEFLDRIVRRLIETVALGVTNIGKRSAIEVQDFDDLRAFETYQLPEDVSLPKGGVSYSALETLRMLQSNVGQLRQFVGRQTKEVITLDKLDEWIAHNKIEQGLFGRKSVDKDKAVRLLTIRRCRIFTEYSHGQDTVRLIDTPGVDDPSPRARQQTLDIIGDEADVLLVLSRPHNPSPTAPVIEFLDSVRRLPDSHPAKELILYGFNRDKRTQDHIHTIEKFMELLERDHDIPKIRMLRPLDVTDPEAVIGFLGEVNQFLQDSLPKRDEAIIQHLREQISRLESRIRMDLLEPMAKDFPSDPQMDSTRFNLFNEWFESFWDKLRKGIAEALGKIEENGNIKASQDRLISVYKREVADLEKDLPELKDLTNTQEVEDLSPTETVMRDTLMPLVGELVNAITREIETFGPIIQTRVCQILEESGLKPLLVGEAPNERIVSLVETMERSSPGSAIADKLREIADTENNLRMVFRWELRPAVDYCVPHYWRDNRAHDQLLQMVDGFGGDASEIKSLPEGRFPTIQSSPQEHLEVIQILVDNSLTAIFQALSNNRFRLSKIAHDILSDSRTAFCFGKGKRSEWQKVLYNQAPLLIPSLGQLERNSAFHRKLSMQLNELGKHISTSF